MNRKKKKRRRKRKRSRVLKRSGRRKEAWTLVRDSTFITGNKRS
jgi:hypothetical protein